MPHLQSSFRAASPLLAVAALALLLGDPATARRADGAASAPLWNPHKSTPGNAPLTVRVLVLNCDPIVPARGHRRLSQVFRWNNPAKLANEYKDVMEYASGGYLRFDIVAWRNLNEIYAGVGGHRYRVSEYVRNRRQNKGWRAYAQADYPRLLDEQNVAAMVDDGRVDEVWVFSDHSFGLYEASRAGPGAFFINGGVYPQTPSRQPFAIYGFNYERGVAEMMHVASHRTEATLNRAYGPWNLKNPQNYGEKFSANHDQSGGLAGVGTCHWPANAKGDYDYGNRRVVSSWADAFLKYPDLVFVRRPVSSKSWSRGPDYHLDYLKWYFAHIPRAAGVNGDARQNNWFKYIFDFQNYDRQGKPLPAGAQLYARDEADPQAENHTLVVAYRSADHIDPRSLGDDDVAVVGPDGKPLTVRLLAGKERDGLSYRVARYQVTAPAGGWAKASAGRYIVSLRAERVRTGTSAALPGGRLGAFRVSQGSESPTPLTADADTTLLAHFEKTAAGGVGKTPATVRKLRYEPGVVSQGVLLGPGSFLSYRTAKILEPRAGTVEFWLRPRWNGRAGKDHIFFQAGAFFDNGLRLRIDAANNVRLIAWGDNPVTPAVERNFEFGVGTSGAGWKAGDWRHIAATWEQSGRLALYVDGQLAQETANGPRLPAFSTPTFSVGGGNLASADAVFDELRSARRARTADEIRASARAARRTGPLQVQASPETLLAGGQALVRAFLQARGGPREDLTRDVARTSSALRVARVDEDGTVQLGRAGQAVLTAWRGGLTASTTVVSDPGLSKAALVRASEVTQQGPQEALIVVSYTSRAVIRADFVGQGNVRVVGRNGFHQFPDLAAVKPSVRTLTATYRVRPPGGRKTVGSTPSRSRPTRLATPRGTTSPRGCSASSGFCNRTRAAEFFFLPHSGSGKQESGSIFVGRTGD